jgi:hypothetical protein
MTTTRTLARVGLGGVLTAEALATWARWEHRRRLFHTATEHARAVGRPCVVVLPDEESLASRALRVFEYGRHYARIIAARSPAVVRARELQRPVTRIADGSAVVYAACVLEYVADVAAAMDEIMRMAGDPEHVFLVTVQPWTLTAALHPRARWAGIADTHVVSMGPVTLAHRGFAAGVVVSLAAASVMPGDPEPPDPVGRPQRK